MGAIGLSRGALLHRGRRFQPNKSQIQPRANVIALTGKGTPFRINAYKEARHQVAKKPVVRLKTQGVPRGVAWTPGGFLHGVAQGHDEILYPSMGQGGAVSLG